MVFTKIFILLWGQGNCFPIKYQMSVILESPKSLRTLEERGVSMDKQVWPHTAGKWLFSPGSFRPCGNGWMSLHLLVVLLSGPSGNEASPPTANPKPIRGATFLALSTSYSTLWKYECWLAKRPDVTLPPLAQTKHKKIPWEVTEFVLLYLEMHYSYKEFWKPISSVGEGEKTVQRR